MDADNSPTDADIARYAEMGAKLLVHHQMWMRCGGSNTYPPADYIPRNPADLARMVKSAHEKGMGVALYMRGVEPWALHMPYWEDLLTKDVDGLYVDWDTPLAIKSPLGVQQGCFKPCDEHFCAYDYFRYTKMLRKRVGEGGFLIGHCSSPVTYLALAVFDGYLAGECSEQRQHLHDSLDSHVFYTMKNCVGGTVIHMNKPNRKAMAYSAATGTSLQNDRGPLWLMWASVPMQDAVIYDSLTENLKVLEFSAKNIQGCVFRISREQCLITVANLGEKPAGGVMTIDMPAIGLVGEYGVTHMSVAKDGHNLKVREAGKTSGRIRIEKLAGYSFCAYKLNRKQV